LSKAKDLSAARQVLRDALRELEDRALNRRDRTQAIGIANERRARAKLPKLAATTVGGWFADGTPARDFESLWALVEVLLEWSEEQQRHRKRSPTGAQTAGERAADFAHWKKLWERAKDHQNPATASTGAPELNAYLTAAREAGTRHPYPGILDREESLPSLPDVYMRQQARTGTSDSPHEPSLVDVTSAGSNASSAVPANEVFQTDKSICLLLAGPGGGKSTLLRTHLADSAECWLDRRAGKTVPIMVKARALTSKDTLPKTLAKAATSELKQYGLLDALTAEFFRRPPRSGVRWLVLIDGLDEIPDASIRRTVLRMLASTAAAAPALYQFVVATRPLPAWELDELGSEVPRFELQPFSRDDLLGYATQWFRSLYDPGRHAKTFMTELEHSNLDVLARTPLMAFMLCQLYTAQPGRQLPEGRSAVYKLFVDQLYRNNAHKQVADTLQRAIASLENSLQHPPDRKAVRRAAKRAIDHLPQLVEYLAHRRHLGNTAPAVVVLTDHPLGKCPEPVDQPRWKRFLGDILRPVGLLSEQAGDFSFLHQTLLEYLAVRNVPNPAAAARLLVSAESDHAFRWDRLPLAWEPSYLGFLVEAAGDDFAADLRAMARGDTGITGCQLIARLASLGIKIPMQVIRTNADTLNAMARRASNGFWVRVRAAEALAQSGDPRGANVLDTLARATSHSVRERVEALEALARVDAPRGADLLDTLARDPNQDSMLRVRAAEALAKMRKRSEGDLPGAD
jgi:hypothetical protein